ncbi:MAG: S8 family serine peptidase [Saprospiraceae bacterium]|jgi:subtilisin family serine protease|nr:S8 family serine peptidase [Saprospiraceae bacterium]
MTEISIAYRNSKLILPKDSQELIINKRKGIDCVSVVIKSKSGLSHIIKKYNSRIKVISFSAIKNLSNQYILYFKKIGIKAIAKICYDYYHSGLVDFCIPNVKYKIQQASLERNDNLYNQQWFFKNTGQFNGIPGEDIKLEAAMEYLALNNINISNNINIAILDDGIDPSHEDIDNTRIIAKFDLLDSDNNPTPSGALTHGTYIAGVIAAIINNSIGIAGINPSTNLIIGRISGNHLDSSTAALGIQKAVEFGARIINLSWGIEFPNPQISEAIEEAYSNNVLIIAASGNYFQSNNTKVLFPGTMDKVLTVGACDQKGKWINLRSVPPNGNQKFGSRYGRHVDLVAPGMQIPTTNYNIPALPFIPTYNYFNGTSAATAIVSGIASLILSIKPSLSNEELKSILLSSTDDISINHSPAEAIGYDHIGHGRINALKAIKMVAQGI